MVLDQFHEEASEYAQKSRQPVLLPWFLHPPLALETLLRSLELRSAVRGVAVGDWYVSNVATMLVPLPGTRPVCALLLTLYFDALYSPGDSVAGPRIIRNARGTAYA